MRRDIEFRAKDVTLRGWLYTPDSGEGPFPTVVAAHGWSCVKEQTLDILGEAFADAGLAALVYDHRNHGDSDGTPRGHIDPWEQIHDYRHAITFAQTLGEVDSERIGVWGTSYSGAHCMVLGAIDRRVKAAAAQVPMLAGTPNIQRLNATMSDWNPLQDYLDSERARWAAGEEPAMIAVCSNDPSTPHAFPGLRTYDFFHAWGEKAGNWKNECTVMSIDLCLEYDPTPYLERLGTTPMLFVLGEDDMTTPPDLALSGYGKISGPKELSIIPGDHYTSYLEYIDIAAGSAADFFVRQLTRKMGVPTAAAVG
ncbi:alpha/beta hydrolase [Rhodococcus qingshengii]|uniref:alpha/beta hydrolase n=1 Tax=Rhodococcus qingshengii TaxID=334542 RepID=UPI0024BAC81B|nr:alpha/beta hydrolase [Rhodococcus qingshengii]MDJ0490925.1 alpha/beta hydrolase [Rhodococcus qingshengii]